MVFLIQNSQNRDTAALQIKLDELIARLEGPRKALLDLEDLDEETLEKLRAEYARLADEARGAADEGADVTPVERSIQEICGSGEGKVEVTVRSTAAARTPPSRRQRPRAPLRRRVQGGGGKLLRSGWTQGFQAPASCPAPPRKLRTATSVGVILSRARHRSPLDSENCAPNARVRFHVHSA